ncbi:MAG: hypothetical protein ACOC0J_02475 [Myxococcota bacterium]
MYPNEPGYNIGASSNTADGTSIVGYMAKVRIAILLLTMVGLLAVVVVIFKKPEEEAAKRSLAATKISLQDPQLRVLAVLGSPTCKSGDAGSETWLYAFDGQERAGCAPIEGDLLIEMNEDGEVASYVPEHGVRMAVTTEVGQMRFRQSVASGDPVPQELPEP